MILFSVLKESIINYSLCRLHFSNTFFFSIPLVLISNMNLIYLKNYNHNIKVR